MDSSHSQMVSLIWNIADDVLRDVFLRGQYRDVILPMVVLRRLDALLEPTKEEVEEEIKDNGGLEGLDEGILTDITGLTYFNTSKWTLNRLKSQATDNNDILYSNFVEYLNGYSENVRDVLKNFEYYNKARKLADNDRLLSIIERITDPRINLTDKDATDPDGLLLPALTNVGMGTVFEELLRRFNEENNEEAGEHFTPRDAISLLAHLIFEPVKDDLPKIITLYDPACGSGGMLIEAVHHMKNDQRCCGAIFGQEKNVTNASVAKMNLFLHGANDFNIMCGDTLNDPKILQNEHLAHFDCVIANPPFSLEDWGAEAWKTDRFGRNIWGTPSDSCGDYAWLQHMVCSMRSLSGRMAVVLPQGVLFRDNESKIREQLVKSDYVEAVVTLGEKLFYGTQLSPCFLVLRNQKPSDHIGKILMVDGSKILTVKRAQNVLSDSDIDRLYQLYLDYSDIENYSKVVSLEEIKDKSFDLSPNKYVDYHKEEIRPYDDVLNDFRLAYSRMIEAEKKFKTLINA